MIHAASNSKNRHRSCAIVAGTAVVVCVRAPATFEFQRTRAGGYAEEGGWSRAEVQCALMGIKAGHEQADTGSKCAEKWR